MSDNQDDFSGDATLDLCVEVSPKASAEPSPETYSNHDSKEATPETITPSCHKDARDALHEMHLSESFFVSDTLDDESLIIPPTPADAVPTIIGTSVGHDTTSIIHETQLLGDENEPSPKKQLLFEEEEEDEWTKPTQPLFPVKEDEEHQIIGPSDGEEENDETFVGTESILGSCYDLPTQPCSLPKESQGSGGDDDWNLQLIESQATQSLDPLPASGPKAKTEESEEKVMTPESKKDKDSLTVEEIIIPENGFQDASKEGIEKNDAEHKDDDAEMICRIVENDDERDKTPSPSKLSEKESTPEEVRLFAEIESLVNAAKAEIKSGLHSSVTSEHKEGLLPSHKNSVSDDSDQDEIAPSQTSRSVDISRENVNIPSSGNASPVTSPRKQFDSDEKSPEVLDTTIKDSDMKEASPAKSKPSPIKKTNRLTKKPLKKLQDDEDKDKTPTNKTFVSSDNGTVKKSSGSASQVSNCVPTSLTPKKKSSDSLKDSETPNLEESEHILEGSEASEKTPVSNSEVLGPPQFSHFRTPFQKKLSGKWSSKAEKRISVEPLLDSTKLKVSPQKRTLGKFTDHKDLQKVLVSVGVDLDEEKLKVLCSSKKQFAEEEVLKRIQRIFIKDSEVFEECVPYDDSHAKVEVSPMSSSSTSASTKTSSFVSSGDMGDISSSMSSKSLSGSSGVMIDVKSSQEELGRSFKPSSQSNDAIPFPSTIPVQKPLIVPTTFSDKISSQEDFKNPVVLVSPIKNLKKINVKKNQASTDSPKAKRMRKLPSKKEEESTTETSDAESIGRKDADSENQPATSRSSKKGRSKRKGRTETKRRTAQKNIPQQSEPSTNGVEIQDIGADVQEMDIGEDLTNDPSPFGEILPGIRVMARWKDGYYYPGIVKRQEIDGRWEVLFDDGALRTVIQDSLLKIPVLQVGTSVLVQSPDGYFDPGTVNSYYRDGKDTGYVIEQPNGVTRRYQRASVILSTEQAKLIINKRPVAPPSLTINLDNIVGGKRKRLSSHQRESSTSPPPLKSTRTSRRKNPDPNLDSTDQQSSAPESVAVASKDFDSLMNQCLEDVSASAGKKQARAKGSKSKKGQKKKPNQSSVPSSNVSIPESVASKETRCEGPPIRSTRLFQNYAFLLTYSNKQAEGEEAEDGTTFDKKHLCQLIMGGGGTIYESFEEAQKCTKKKIILLASTYVRTIKYLQCVAANIPCIQHYWIQNCVLTRTIVEYGTYILNTGFSIIHKEPIQWHGKTNIFEGLKIVITADKKMGKEFVNLWTPVLLAAKAELVQKWILPSLFVQGTSYPVNLIVTNHTCPPNILEAAKRRKIPVVSSEYIIQCIINGYQLPPDGHEKFKHDFKA